jgi:hypothetical protein
VVTTFFPQAYTQDHIVWHGNLILHRSALGAAIEVANNVFEKGNEGVAATGMLWGKAPGQAHPGLVIISYYDGKQNCADLSLLWLIGQEWDGWEDEKLRKEGAIEG